VTAWCKILHSRVGIRRCKIHPQLAPRLFYPICTVQLPTPTGAAFILPYMYCATPKINLPSVGGVFYTAEQLLRGVRSYMAESALSGVRYTANWRPVYFTLYVLCISQNKLAASWQCILHCRTATARSKILHGGVGIWRCKIHCQLAPCLFCLICTVQLPK